MVRVAIFTDNDFGKINGVTTTLKAVLRFAGGPVEPRIYTCADVELETPSYCAARSLGIGLPFYKDMRVYWPRLRRFAHELRRRRVQVIHATTPGPVGLAARWLAAHLGLPLVGSYHTELGEYISRLSGSKRLGAAGEWYVRNYYTPCDPLLVPSMATRDLLTARGYRADRLRIWSRGVDTTQFDPKRASAALRRRWRGDDRRPVILYAGRVSREKGLSLIAPIRRALLGQAIDHQFVFAGDGPMRHELQALCPDAVFTGALSHDDVAAVMASSDVFLFPSATDTLGNVVLEAQAAGLPVIVSDQGGPQQNIVRGETGLVCRADRADDFVAAVVSLLTRPQRRAEMGAHARAYALTRDWPKAMTPLIDTWCEAAERRARAAQPLMLGHAAR